VPRAKLLILLILTAALCLNLGACAPGEKPPENIGNFEFTPENYPAMGGSLAALPLGEAVTAAVLGTDRARTGEHILFEGSTTSNYMELASGRFDILLAYEPSEQAKQFAADGNFEWEMTPVGRDALVFIANKANPVTNLTGAQISGIYSGAITDWRELGGNEAPIIPYQRNKDSGSQTLFDKIINLGGDLLEPPSEQVIGSMIGLLEAVAEYDDTAPNALGYTVYYYLTNMEKEKLENTQILTVDGVECNNDTIRSGEYPYVNDFYVVIEKGFPEDAPAKVLRDWICSEQGRELTERENYVAL
jgi:phosphate transport system substrate-binding protein